MLKWYRGLGRIFFIKFWTKGIVQCARKENTSFIQLAQCTNSQMLMSLWDSMSPCFNVKALIPQTMFTNCRSVLRIFNFIKKFSFLVSLLKTLYKFSFKLIFLSESWCSVEALYTIIILYNMRSESSTAVNI